MVPQAHQAKTVLQVHLVLQEMALRVHPERLVQVELQAKMVRVVQVELQVHQAHQV